MLSGSRAIYKAMLERVDAGVGMILRELERLGIADNTLVVFSSDNGGERWSSNAPLFHHKATLWEGGIRVPCLMRWPAKLPKGKTTAQMGITMDLHATFLAAAGAPQIKGAALDGVDLLPLLAGPTRASGRFTGGWIGQPKTTRDSAGQLEIPQRRQHDGSALRFER